MIVKLKCIDNEGYDYFTVGKVYNANVSQGHEHYWLLDDNYRESIVSTCKLCQSR